MKYAIVNNFDSKVRQILVLNGENLYSIII